MGGNALILLAGAGAVFALLFGFGLWELDERRIWRGATLLVCAAVVPFLLHAALL
jgi:hypothetical protein